MPTFHMNPSPSGGGILQLTYDKFGTKIKLIDEIIELSSCPSNWIFAKEKFFSARTAVLKLERSLFLTKHQTLKLCLLYVAENVAKVIYNASLPADPFDEDVGEWVAKCFWDFRDELADSEFDSHAISVLLDLDRDE